MIDNNNNNYPNNINNNSRNANNNNNSTADNLSQEEQRTRIPNISFSFIINNNNNNNDNNGHNNLQQNSGDRIASEQTNNNNNNNDNHNDTNNNGNGQEFHFFIMPFPAMNGENPSQFVFFAPIIMTPPEPPKRPNVPESIMKKLPIVKITKEHVDSLATCSICLEHFHIQDNTCPLCRYELPSEEPQQQQESNNINDIATNNHDSNESSIESTNVPLSNTLSNMNEGLPTSSSTSSLNHSNLGCALTNLGICEVTNINNNDDNSNSDGGAVGSLSSTIITLPQCHHRFHASCLRNALLISGYSLESNSLDFRCPICRALPLIINFNDEMDLD
nr:1107_t:CDS:2 [Entrophospora candida]